MLPTEDLFVYVYVLIDDAIAAGIVAIPARPGPAPGCSDAELLAIALVRHLLGRRSETGFFAEVARDWAHLFPVLPHQSEANRRIRWLWGAFEHFRAHLAAGVPADDCQQIDTSALPVKHPSRIRGPDGWTGPNGQHARFGRDAAHDPAHWARLARLRPGRVSLAVFPLAGPFPPPPPQPQPCPAGSQGTTGPPDARDRSSQDYRLSVP